MVIGADGVVWVEGELGLGQEQENSVSWTRNDKSSGGSNGMEIKEQEEEADIDAMSGSLSTFKSMLETTIDWYMNPPPPPVSHHHDLQSSQEIRELSFYTNPSAEALILQHPMDSSSSCSPSQPFSLDPSRPQPSFLAPKTCFSSLLSVPFDNAFDFGSEPAFLPQFQPTQVPNLTGFSSPDFQSAQLLPVSDGDGSGGYGGVGGLGGYDNSLFLNMGATALRPVEVLPQPTLFQKRAAMRQSSDKLGNLEVSGLRYGEMEREMTRNRIEEGEMEEASMDVSCLNYDSDEPKEESLKCNSNANSTVTGNGGGNGDLKGKKKGMPAKNLMAERRRRKKLNDRLYMLRSVVPKISKVQTFSS